jgi:hypothetical protein
MQAILQNGSNGSNGFNGHPPLPSMDGIIKQSFGTCSACCVPVGKEVA